MKFATALVALASTALVSAVNLRYDTVYDKSSNRLDIVACSDGENGLITAGYSTFGSLPRFPHIGSGSAVSGWNDADCGSCWKLTYTNSKGVSKSINVILIDHADDGFVVSKAAMNELTGNQAVQLGKVSVTSQKLSPSSCGL
jgi:hypothetical protein